MCNGETATVGRNVWDAVVNLQQSGRRVSGRNGESHLCRSLHVPVDQMQAEHSRAQGTGRLDGWVFAQAARQVCKEWPC